MVQVSTNIEGTSSLVICNLWRIDRSKQGGIKAFEFDLVTAQWSEVRTFDYWPDVPLYPIQMAQTLDWWRDVVRRVVWKALIAAGYSTLPEHVSDVKWGYDNKTGGAVVDSGKLDMSPRKMAYILIQRYIGKVIGRTKAGKDKWRDGFLKPKVMVAGARALRASIFDHVLEADLLSAILAIDYKLVSFCGYLKYAVYRDAVLRVARERRNFLPLLPEISKSYWARDDLFSRKIWVKDGRKRTVVDYARFGAHPRHGFCSLESRSALRWIGKAQLTVVRSWASPMGGRKNTAVLENLSRANITVKIPALAWRHIMSASAGRVSYLGVSESAQRLYRTFAAHCAAMWKEQGFAALKQWLRDEQSNLGDVADWLFAEGAGQGFPDKHSTWDSLKRRCDDWHERVAIENVERSSGEDQTWESLLGEVVFNEVIFTPLTSVKDVAIEGYRQHHCVGSYAYDCVDGYYRVFTALEPDGTRSTLGLWLNQAGQWIVEQHRGKYNGSVSVEATKAGRELAKLYHEAHVRQV